VRTFLNERLEVDHAEVTSIMVGKKTKIPMDCRLMKKGVLYLQLLNQGGNILAPHRGHILMAHVLGTVV
jgi:hypothetical protein